MFCSGIGKRNYILFYHGEEELSSVLAWGRGIIFCSTVAWGRGIIFCSCMRKKMM
jgi:hypothetical protein